MYTNFSRKGSELLSKKIWLRTLAPEDKHAVFRLRSDDRVNQYLDREKPADPENAMEFISNMIKNETEEKNYYWAIAIKGKTELIGTICLYNFSENKETAEIGYELLPEYQGRGIMKETIRIVLNFAFSELGLQKIIAYSHRDNYSSARLLEKNGFLVQPRQNDPNNQFLVKFCLLKPIDD